VFCARDTPPGRALRECADSQEEELCEFYHLKEASTEGAFIGLLNTQRFPESTGAVDQDKDRWRAIPRSRTSGFRRSAFRGFRPRRKLVSWIRDPRNPEVTWHVGPRFLVEYRWKHIGILGIEVPIEGRGGGVESTRAIAYRHIGVRGSGIHSVSESLFHIGRFPDRESPNGTEC
jgi:hypothetical protein